MTTTDRRVRRTREMLQQALIALVGERRYEAITIQDIADRANVARATFYLHYTDKDALFMDCHEAIVGTFLFGPHHPLSRAELLSPDAPVATAGAYHHLAAERALVQRLFGGKDGPLLLRRIRDSGAREIAACLRAAFPEAEGTMPLDVLAHYLAGALGGAGAMVAGAGTALLARGAGPGLPSPAARRALGGIRARRRAHITRMTRPQGPDNSHYRSMRTEAAQEALPCGRAPHLLASEQATNAATAHNASDSTGCVRTQTRVGEISLTLVA